MTGSEWKSAMVGAVLGSLLGGVFTYIASLKVMEEEIRVQAAREFVSRHYLPLAGLGLEFYALAKEKEPNFKLVYHCLENIEKSLDAFVKSGVILVLHRVDKKLASRILTFRIYLLKHKRELAPAYLTKEKIQYLEKKLQEITRPLFQLSIHRLGDEYRKIQEKPWFSK